MLKVFRDNLKRLVWILWVVIAAFILLVFVDFGRAGYQGKQKDRTAATVGDEQITIDDFRRQYLEVGARLADLANRRGEAAVDPLRQRYFAIPFADSLRSESIRRDAGRILRELATAIDRALR